MGKCIYCGKDAGFLRSSHKECREKHETGKTEILRLASSAASGDLDLRSAGDSIREVASASYVDSGLLKSLLIRAFEDALNRALDDDILTREEEESLSAYMDHFELDQQDLDVNGAYTRLVKAGVLRDILEGRIPERVKVQGTLPFNLQKSEKLVWVFQDVPYFEIRTRTAYRGGYKGVSIRVAKGVYYRVGGFRGNPVVTTQMVLIAGILGVTNKHVYFTGSAKSFRIRYDRIVSFSPFSDGIAIQRDAARAKPQVFKTGDGWFTYNLLVNLANLMAA